jgi:hypothetical protein
MISELRRLRQQAKDMLPPPRAASAVENLEPNQWLDWLAENFPIYLQQEITGSSEFAHTLEGFDGRLSRAPGFMEAFREYWHLQYQGFPYADNLFLFVPGHHDTEREQARQKVVLMLREQLLATGDAIDAKLAELLCDEALTELNCRRWYRHRGTTPATVRAAGSSEEP